MNISSDYLVIGSGIAGLTFALKAAKTGSVTIVTKRDIREGATFYAQGGIASVSSTEDSFESHIKDTLDAGAGLCDRSIVELVVKDAPARIDELINLGVKFTRRADTELDLGKEGGHSKRRIVHAQDLTGKVVEEALVAAVYANPNIKIFENHIAVDLISHSKFIERKPLAENDTIWGAYILDKKTGDIGTFTAKATVLATGGAGKVYLFTSNPDVATGDGIAMSYRAGAAISNMEFMQFHPTCLYHSRAKSFLVSEAVRGEGGILKLKNGAAFMKSHHPMADLAPRDIVARAIDYELKLRGDECVYLDITHKPKEFIIERFPNIHNKCLEFGIDMTKDPIPVVPAAHYICGGVKTDDHGKATLNRLYAIGECAHTGLHGANRLASNSLLESLVFADRASAHSLALIKETSVIPNVPTWETRGAVASDEAVVISQNWDEIRRFMWNYVGIVRSDKRLERAGRRIELLKKEINEYYWNFKVTSDLVELRNIADAAELIIKSATLRKESRGLHYTIDYPDKNDRDFGRDTVVRID